MKGPDRPKPVPEADVGGVRSLANVTECSRRFETPFVVTVRMDEGQSASAATGTDEGVRI